MNPQSTPPTPPSDSLMKPSKVAAAVGGDPSFFEALVNAQAMSGSGHHLPDALETADTSAAPDTGAAA